MAMHHILKMVHGAKSIIILKHEKQRGQMVKDVIEIHDFYHAKHRDWQIYKGKRVAEDTLSWMMRSARYLKQKY